MNARTVMIGCALALLAPGAARASDPVGVYAIVGKVAFEPSPDKATRVRICGTFAMAVANSGGRYSAPQDGYLYYQCRAGEEAACRMQWQDIQKAMDKGSCIGFGDRYAQGGNGRVRTQAPPQDPDTYPLGIGVVPMPHQVMESLEACRSLMGRQTMHAACNSDPGPGPGPGTPPVTNPPTSAGSGCAMAGTSAPVSLLPLLLLGLAVRVRARA
jgi:hypothetical protein